jgi:diphthamide synthase subunit DPH2
MVEATHPAPDAWVFPQVGDELFEALRQARPGRIVLQVPAGLIRNATDLVDRIRTEVGAPVVLAARACFGGCDFPSHDEAPRADVAVVLGARSDPERGAASPNLFCRDAGSGRGPAPAR